MRHVIGFVLLLVLFSCKSKEPQNVKDFVETGKVDAEKMYIDSVSGWNFKMPEGWSLVTLKETAQRQEKGKKMIQETFNQQVEMDPVVQLISMKMNDRNIMEANRMTYDTTLETNKEEVTTSVFQLLKMTYTQKGIKYQALTGAEKIDGIMFDTYSVKVFDPTGKKVVLKQELFSTLIKDQVFTITVSYNKEEEGTNMLEAVRASKFYEMNERAKADSLLHK
jgi:hypothetical protein